MTKPKCKEKVYNSLGWKYFPCSRYASKDGYCKQHHPDSVRARNVERDRKCEEKRKQSSWYLLEKAKERIVELEKELNQIKEAK